MAIDNDIRVIQAFAEDFNYKFFATRQAQDFNNLLDSGHEGFYLFVAQGTMQPQTSNDTGFSLSEVYTGQIYVCKPSDLDGVIITEDGQDDKFDAVDKALKLTPYFLLNIFQCDLNPIITCSNVKPFYNWAGINYDGIVFDYRIEFKNVQGKLTKAEMLNIIENG